MTDEQTNATETTPAATWAIVELMGHSRYAGRISPDNSLGFPLLRIDVPAVGGRAGFTKLAAPSSIFGVTPCTEAMARDAAFEFRAQPVSLFSVPDSTRRLGYRDPEDE